VDGAHGARSCIGKQQRDAVGCAHGNGHFGMIGHEDIGFRSFDRGVVSAPDHNSAIAMHLRQRRNG
jgi:hypothetical protein